MKENTKYGTVRYAVLSNLVSFKPSQILYISLAPRSQTLSVFFP